MISIIEDGRFVLPGTEALNESGLGNKGYFPIKFGIQKIY